MTNQDCVKDLRAMRERVMGEKGAGANLHGISGRDSRAIDHAITFLSAPRAERPASDLEAAMREALTELKARRDRFDSHEAAAGPLMWRSLAYDAIACLGTAILPALSAAQTEDT